MRKRGEALFLAGVLVLVSAAALHPLLTSVNAADPDPVSTYYEYTTTIINGTALNSTNNLDADDGVYYAVDCATVTGYPSEEYDYVDNNISDVDASADKGTHSNFTAQQYGPDSVYDTLTEEDTSGASSDNNVDSEIVTHGSTTGISGAQTTNDATENMTEGSSVESLYVDSFDSTHTGWSTSGTSPWLGNNNDYIYTASEAAQEGNFGFVNSAGSGTINSVTLYMECYQAGTNEWIDVWISDGVSFSDIGDISPPSSYGWQTLDVSSKLDTWTKIDNAEMYVIYSKAQKPDNVYIRRAYLYVDYTVVENYQSEIEHIVNSITNYENYNLTVRAYRSAENFYLQMYNFTSSSWVNMSTISASSLTWYNVTFAKTNFINSTNQARIRYYQDVDATQEVLFVDYSGIYGWNSSNYELDLEVQWTNAEHSRTNEELCIYVGTTDAENIRVNVWNTTTSMWDNVFTDLTANSWNNISVTSWLTSSNFTIRFKGGTETGDTSQDTWQIDCALLHTWEAVTISEVDVHHTSQPVTESLAHITQIFFEDNFKSNTTTTAYLEWFNWTAHAWANINSGLVGPTEVTWSKTWTSGFIDVINSTNYMKVRIYTSNESNAHRLLEDYLHWDVTYVVPDTAPPAWSNAGTNNTLAGEPTLFYVKWTDNVGLSGFIFGTNNTGTWVNDTWTPMGGTTNLSNVTKTLNSTVGIVVEWRVWANDTSNNWNDTGTLSLTTTTGYALNLRVKDWDLVDPISGAYVYVDSDVKISNANGWANWTGLSGTVNVKVKWYGAWVNGTSVAMDSDKTIDVQCNIFDITVTCIEGVQSAVLQYVNVTVCNGTSVPSNMIRTGITGYDGKVILANVPNSTLILTCYDGASPRHVIANVTKTMTTENQAETITCDQNYVSTTTTWSIIEIIYSSSFYLGLILLPEFCSRCIRCLKERIKTIRSKQNKRRGGKKTHESSNT